MKQKKNLMILLLIAVIGIVGVTIAYFSSRATFENVFETPEYGTQYIEKFTSPDNWLPGDVTEKTLEVRNSGTVDEAVRVKVEESWVSKNGTTLLLKQGDNVAADIHWINGDDWTKVTVDGEDYYYYYYNYKLAPGETTSKLLDKVTFNPLINATTSCTDTVVDGVLRRTCNSNGAGYDGATYTLKFTIETVQYNKYQDAWNVDVAIAEEKPHPGTLTLLEKTNPVSVTNYTDGDIHEMYTIEHGATAQTPSLTDYRYIGNDPYNYVYFNCDSLDNQNSTSCEVWRIIGVFDVEREIDDEDNPGEKKTITETRMKLVRGFSFASTMQWSTNKMNDWTIATLKTYLNTTYYNGLQTSAKGMIDEAKFYLGAVTSSAGPTEKIYSEERGDVVCPACNGDNTKLTWQGNVGLLYPSDEFMVYACGVNNTCYKKAGIGRAYSDCKLSSGWVYNSNIKESESSRDFTWLLSPWSGSSESGYRDPLDASQVKGSLGVRPVVYLSATVQIIDGDGSEQNPYKLK